MTPSSPSAPLAMTNSTSPSKRLRSTLTTRSAYFISGTRGLLHLFALRARLFDGADHVKSLLGEVIVLALQDLGEGRHRLAHLDVLALAPRETLRDAEGLGEKSLDLACARDRQLVVLRQLLHTEDGDDVLQVLVALHGFLDALGGVVVLLPDDRGLHESTRRTEGVDGGIDSDLDQRPLQPHRRAQVGEHGLNRGVGVVVRRHIHSLHRGDRTFAGRCDPLLQLAHLGGQCGLVADGRWHAAEQRGHFGPREQVAEDVVDEQEDVRPLLIAEVLRHRQAREPHACAGARRLVHLAEDQRGLREHAGVLHLAIHVVALARPLPHAGEHRTPLVVVRDVADELLDDDGLPRTGASEQPDLRALGERADEVDDLDPGLEDLDLGLLLRHRRSEAVDGPAYGAFGSRLVLEGGADDIEQATQGFDPDRHRDRRTRGDHLVASSKAIGGVHGDALHHVVSDRTRDLEHHRLAVLLHDLEGLVKLRLLSRRKGHVDDSSDHLPDFPFPRPLLGVRHASPLYVYVARSASAPPTISISSVVMPACRTLLAKRVRDSMKSPAALVAFCMAIILAEYSLALFSRTAW